MGHFSRKHKQTQNENREIVISFEHRMLEASI